MHRPLIIGSDGQISHQVLETAQLRNYDHWICDKSEVYFIYSIAQDLRIWYHYNQINPPAWAWQDPLRSHMVKNLLETNGERQHQLLARNGWSFHKNFSIILPRIWLSNYGKPFCVIACITHFSYFLRGLVRKEVTMRSDSSSSAPHQHIHWVYCLMLIISYH